MFTFLSWLSSFTLGGIFISFGLLNSGLDAFFSLANLLQSSSIVEEFMIIIAVTFIAGVAIFEACNIDISLINVDH